MIYSQEMARRAADILAENRIGRYPLNPMGLADRYGIKVIPYPLFARLTGNTLETLLTRSGDGFSTRKNDCPLIAYNPSIQSKGRRRWTLLHEISHFLLGHVAGDEDERRSLPEEELLRREREAHQLAAGLIAPLGLAHLCNTQSDREMQTVFGLSQEAAGYFLRDLNRLRWSGRIRDWIFLDCLSACLPFIAERLLLQYRVQCGFFQPDQSPGIRCDNPWEQ